METRVTGSQASVYKVGPNDVAGRSLPLTAIEVATSKQVGAGASGKTIPSTSHGAKLGNIIRFTSGDWTDYEFAVVRVIDANNFEISYSFETGQAPAENDEFSVFKLVTPQSSSTGSSATTIQFTRDSSAQEVIEDTVTPTNNRPLPVKLIDDEGTIDTRAFLESIESELIALSSGQLLDIVDTFDTRLLDASSTNIPASGATNPVEVVASLAAACEEIEVVDDIGEYIEIWIGADPGAFKTSLPLGGGRVKCHIDAGTRVALKAAQNSAISSGKMTMNFLG